MLIDGEGRPHRGELQLLGKIGCDYRLGVLLTSAKAGLLPHQRIGLQLSELQGGPRSWRPTSRGCA